MKRRAFLGLLAAVPAAIVAKPLAGIDWARGGVDMAAGNDHTSIWLVEWDNGSVHVRDWRYACRIENVDAGRQLENAISCVGLA